MLKANRSNPIGTEDNMAKIKPKDAEILLSRQIEQALGRKGDRAFMSQVCQLAEALRKGQETRKCLRLDEQTYEELVNTPKPATQFAERRERGETAEAQGVRTPTSTPSTDLPSACAEQPSPLHPSDPADLGAQNVTLGNILDQTKRLLAEADALDRERDERDLLARRKRIEAALLMRQAERMGMKLTKLYEQLGISRKSGRTYMALADAYEEIDATGLDKRQDENGLLSMNQAETLAKAVSELSDAEEKERTVREVRDESDLKDPTFGPESIWRIAGGQKKGNDLRAKLEIEQSRIDELRKTAPEQVKYEAEISADEIIIRAPSLPLAFAALTNSSEQVAKALEFFSKGGEFVITRKGA